eukprot:402951-Amphidinium_carterae.2
MVLGILLSSIPNYWANQNSSPGRIALEYGDAKLRRRFNASDRLLRSIKERAHYSEDDLRNVSLSDEEGAARSQLSYMLIMICRDAPLTPVINAGEGKDIQLKLEEFERLVAKYEAIAKEKMTDALRVGLICRSLPESALKQRILMNLARLDTLNV